MKTIAARIILIFLCAGAFQTICIWGAYTIYGREQRARDYDFMAADVALAQQVMRSVPPENREELLRSYNRGFYHFVLSKRGTSWRGFTGSAQLGEIVDVIQRHLRPPDRSTGVFQPSNAGGTAGVSVPVDRDVDLVVSFDDQQPYSGPPDRLVIGYLIAIFLIAAAAAALAVRIATRPLRTLATAAGHLASNLERYHLAAQQAIALSDAFFRITRDGYLKTKTLPPFDSVVPSTP